MCQQIFDRCSIDFRCSYRNLWWPSAAECGVTPRDFLIFVDFCQKCHFLSPGGQIACKSRKTTFYVFCIFTPLYRRFSLSSVAHGSGFDEIYRLLSKILHLTSYGSKSIDFRQIFDRFSIDFRQIFEVWRRTAGGLEEAWGGLEEDLRMCQQNFRPFGLYCQ